MSTNVLKLVISSVLVASLPQIAVAESQEMNQTTENVRIERSILPGENQQRDDDLRYFGIDPEELKLEIEQEDAQLPVAVDSESADDEDSSYGIAPADGSEIMAVKDNYNYAISREVLFAYYVGILHFNPSKRTTANPGSGLKPYRHVRRGGMEYKRGNRSLNNGPQYTSWAKSKKENKDYRLQIDAWDHLLIGGAKGRTDFFRYWKYF